MINIIKLEVNIAKTYHFTNTYIIYDENKNGVIIDPGDEFYKIKEKIDEENLTIKYLILTHAHFDHVNALEETRKYTNATVIVNENDYNMLIGKIDNAASYFNSKNITIDGNCVKKVTDKEKINVGNIEFTLYHTPGHTSGSMVVWCGSENILFTGDTLFSREYGRCDLPTGDYKQMKESLNRIFDIFNENTVIYPGHGESSILKNTKKYITLLLAIKNNN